jgi:hypothetical protein
VAKTESTAVTRLIELAQERSVQGDLDWFAPPPRKRIPREEVTQVVRVARALRASPLTVLGAFLLGMLTVIITTIVLRTSPEPDPVPAPAPVPAAAPVVVPIAPEPPRRDPIPPEVAVVAPEPQRVPIVEPEPEPEPPKPAPKAKPRELKPTARSRPATKAAPTPGPLSELRINSKPPCELYLDGRKIGWTPQRGITVAPGRHTIVFRNREQGIDRKVLVDAKVGEVHKLIRDFTEP